jgi:hypothetical protein
VECFEFGRSIVGKLKLAFDLLGGHFAQVLVDDIADGS